MSNGLGTLQPCAIFFFFCKQRKRFPILSKLLEEALFQVIYVEKFLIKDPHKRFSPLKLEEKRRSQGDKDDRHSHIFDTFPRLKQMMFVRSTFIQPSFSPPQITISLHQLRNHLLLSLHPLVTFDFKRNVFVNMSQCEQRSSDDYVKGCDVRGEM